MQQPAVQTRGSGATTRSSKKTQEKSLCRSCDLRVLGGGKSLTKGRVRCPGRPAAAGAVIFNQAKHAMSKSAAWARYVRVFGEKEENDGRERSRRRTDRYLRIPTLSLSEELSCSNSCPHRHNLPTQMGRGRGRSAIFLARAWREYYQ